jgi:hypothetical protein
MTAEGVGKRRNRNPIQLETNREKWTHATNARQRNEEQSQRQEDTGGRSKEWADQGRGRSLKESNVCGKRWEFVAQELAQVAYVGYCIDGES